MILYFAYGSNMHPRVMGARCPGARAIGPARLDGWRFLINKRGAASIWPDADHAVHGVLWWCNLGHIEALDAYEGVRWRNYFRRRLFVAQDAGEAGAFVYTGSRHMPGVARPNYLLSAVLPGAREFGLPRCYIAQLESWLPRRPLGAHGPGRQYLGRRRPVRFPR
jgi:gamma-glutamylcyclotransferase (GGCT)/AIG2-like uncharacterized protein YtfP